MEEAATLPVAIQVFFAHPNGSASRSVTDRTPAMAPQIQGRTGDTQQGKFQGALLREGQAHLIAEATDALDETTV